ncbi:MAG: alpha-amylase, partial [Polaribacter sp.]|nr:alpha-amylase [Polaribacter sp.]
NTENYNAKLLSFTRFSNNEKLIIVPNFDAEKAFEFELKIPLEIIKKWNINEGTFLLKDKLYNKKSFDLKVTSSGASAKILVNPLESFILKLQ